MAVKKINIGVFLEGAAVKITELVREDSLESVWQDNSKGGEYSAGYKKYKANDMRRFTDGKRLKAVGSASLPGTQNTKVNMTLTGSMANSYKGTKFTKDSFVMSYKKKMAGRIIGNRELGRDVVGLNDKNEKIISDMFTRELVKYFRTI